MSESKNNIISINLNWSNNFSLYSLESKSLVCINYVLSPFFCAIFPSKLTVKIRMFCKSYND